VAKSEGERLPLKKRIQVLQLLPEGMALRPLRKALNVSPNTINSLLIRA